MRISDWSSDVCSSDLAEPTGREITRLSGNERYTGADYHRIEGEPGLEILSSGTTGKPKRIRFPYRMLIRMVDMVRVSQMDASLPPRSEEHTSELQSLMRISYAVFCLKKKKIQTT